MTAQAVDLRGITYNNLLAGRKPSTVLREALQLLHTSGLFCQGTPALAASFDSTAEFADPEDLDYWACSAVRPTDPRANCWALDGAIARSTNTLGLVPPELWDWLDAAVLDYARLRGLRGVVPAFPPGPHTVALQEEYLPALVYFADNAQPQYLLEFLVYAATLLEQEGN